jgi:hypothetical protein
MTLAILIATLDARGVRLSVRLVVDAPRGVLTPEIKAALADHKSLLLLRLAREDQWEALRDERWGQGICDPTPGIDYPGRPRNPDTCARAKAATDSVPPSAADPTTSPNPMDASSARAIMKGSGTGTASTAPAPLIRPLA